MRFSLSTGLALVLCLPGTAAPKRAKNVILFVADAGGIATVSAASLHGYGEPQKLYVQSWPYVGLSDTTSATDYVVDSAAGMTAIATGVKTLNGIISQGPDAVRGKRDGKILKTVLEYAEERGLSTGVLSNVSIADATPAACYGHANDRSKQGELFLQIFQPRFGDGVDVVMGLGRKTIFGGAGAAIEQAAKTTNRPVYALLAEAPEDAKRPIVVQDSAIDLPAATRRALKTLGANKKGYFLMVEWDAHADDVKKGLDNVVAFDKLIREIASQVSLKETLLLFTADHSFELRITGGKRGTPLLNGWDQWKSSHLGAAAREEIRIPAMRVGHAHTAEEVLVTAQGPGAERVRGYMPNTRLFEVMLDAFGWKPDRDKMAP